MPRTEEAILKEFYRLYDDKFKQDGEYYKNEYQKSEGWSANTMLNFFGKAFYRPVSQLENYKDLNGIIYHALFDPAYNASGVNRTTQVLVEMGLFKDSQGHEIEDIPALDAAVNWAKDERIRVLEEQARELAQKVRELEDKNRAIEQCEQNSFQSLEHPPTSPSPPI